MIVMRIHFYICVGQMAQLVTLAKHPVFTVFWRRKANEHA